jgi:hypothetical protein
MTFCVSVPGIDRFPGGLTFHTASVTSTSRTRIPMGRFLVCLTLMLSIPGGLLAETVVKDSSPLADKADFFQRDLVDKHWLDGLYVSIVPSAPAGTKLPPTVNEPGNVIHAGVWTGRFLAGVGYNGVPSLSISRVVTAAFTRRSNHRS